MPPGWHDTSTSRSPLRGWRLGRHRSACLRCCGPPCPTSATDVGVPQRRFARRSVQRLRVPHSPPCLSCNACAARTLARARGIDPSIGCRLDASRVLIEMRPEHKHRARLIGGIGGRRHGVIRGARDECCSVLRRAQCVGRRRRGNTGGGGDDRCSRRVECHDARSSGGVRECNPSVQSIRALQFERNGRIEARGKLARGFRD